jgi:hypothetical protein
MSPNFQESCYTLRNCNSFTRIRLILYEFNRIVIPFKRIATLRSIIMLPVVREYWGDLGSGRARGAVREI